MSEKSSYVELQGPVIVRMGKGKVLCLPYQNEDCTNPKNTLNRGLVLHDTGKAHPIGEKARKDKEPHTPCAGEVYLDFENLESAKAFSEAVHDMIFQWENPQSPVVYHDEAPPTHCGKEGAILTASDGVACCKRE